MFRENQFTCWSSLCTPPPTRDNNILVKDYIHGNCFSSSLWTWWESEGRTEPLGLTANGKWVRAGFALRMRRPSLCPFVGNVLIAKRNTNNNLANNNFPLPRRRRLPTRLIGGWLVFLYMKASPSSQLERGEVKGTWSPFICANHFELGSSSSLWSLVMTFRERRIE